MTDERTYDADSDADDEQMTHFDPLAELHARIAQVVTLRAQLAEAMAMAGELSAELEDAKRRRDAWKTEAMLTRCERAQLVKENARLTAAAAANIRVMLTADKTWREENDALKAECNSLRDNLTAARVAIFNEARRGDEFRAERDEANAQAEIYRNERDAQRRIWLADCARMDTLKDMQSANVRFTIDALHKWQAEMDALRAERDAAVRRADDAIEAYSVVACSVSGAGWWC